MADLFSHSETPRQIDLPQACLQLFHNILPETLSQSCFEQLSTQLQWQQPEVFVYGKTHKTPRLVSWAGDAGLSYSYSGLSHDMQGWPQMLDSIRDKVQALSGHEFNSVLLNLYRDGQDSMGWHSDDEVELGQNPVIASLSFGASRRFLLRHKNSGERYELLLQDGDLLLMKGQTQHFWQHSLPRSAKCHSPRINLTFRQLIN